ncbi:MAG: peptide chain release factor N(5)-glutamine methyltransferase [Betaproteobacteria bacterium]
MNVTVGAALAQAGLIPLEAQVLLAFVLHRDRSWLIAHRDDGIGRAESDAFFALTKRRREGEPVAYLTGTREFWGLALNVTPDVLIPRPETETLVEMALARMPVDGACRVLDLGTGSGAIALALAHERPRAQIVGSDASTAALDVARGNAARLGLDRVTFVHADWYAGVPDGPYDLIVSNPPYIAGGDPHLVDGDLRFEPASALTPGGDGLHALASIVEGASARLVAAGTLLVEHGYEQADAVRAMLLGAGLVELVATRDLAGHWRVAGGAKQGEPDA